MTPRFDIVEAALRGLRIIQRKPIADNRGYLERLLCTTEMEPVLAGKNVVQINRTLTSKRGTVRGMHFQQPPHAEMKVVTCLRGEVFDVAVDLREGSTTFLQWHGELLTGRNHKSLLIPEGFAHGFQCLIDDCEMLYFHTAEYQPASERGLNPTDPRLGIRWPEPVTEMSARDGAQPLLTSAFRGVEGLAS
jgi:dTDP-4-dehydrorhamnose 3,5-epimerase